MSEDTRRSRDKQDEELGDTQRESIKQSLANTPLTPAGANEGLELKEIETAKIVYGPFQYRDSSSNLAKVRESIGQHGLIEPVLVRPLPNGVFEIVCGHTRFGVNDGAKGL